MAQPVHLQLCDKWMLIKDVKGILKRERQRFNADGEHLVGYPYVDHTAGLSMRVHLFCQSNFLRSLKVTADVIAQNVALIIRYDVLSQCEVKPLDQDQIEKFKLPEKPDYLTSYEKKEVEPLRWVEVMHPLRAPGFPDDIRFVLAQPGKQVEEVWGRLERRLSDNVYECILLNQPHQDFGLKAGDHVAVGVALAGNGIVSQCLGLAEDMKK
jgi:hypothetical protein